MDEEYGKKEKFKSKIGPDIWFWEQTAKGKLIPTNFLTLQQVEIKFC
jgi:hypothetical protein